MVLYANYKKRITSILIYPAGHDVARQFHDTSAYHSNKMKTKKPSRKIPTLTQTNLYHFTLVRIPFVTIISLSFQLDA